MAPLSDDDKWSKKQPDYNFCALLIINGWEASLSPAELQKLDPSGLGGWPNNRFRPNLKAMRERFRERGRLDWNENLLPPGFEEKAEAIKAASEQKAARNARTPSKVRMAPDDNNEFEEVGEDGLHDRFDALDISDDDDDDNDFMPKPKLQPAGKAIKKAPAVVKAPATPVLPRAAKNEMSLPSLGFVWEDIAGHERVTFIVHLPAGAGSKDVIKLKIVKNRTVILEFDWTQLWLLDVEKYGLAFMKKGVLVNGKKVSLYDKFHVKTVGHRKAIRAMKNQFPQNRVVSTFSIQAPIDIENAVTDLEGYPGFQTIKMGPKENPQVFAHIECIGKQIGYYSEQPTEFDDYTVDEDDDGDY